MPFLTNTHFKQKTPICNKLYKCTPHSIKNTNNSTNKQTNYYYIYKLPSNPMNTSSRNQTQPLVLVQEERNGPIFLSLLLALSYANGTIH